VIVLALSACWKTDPATVDFTDVPYENPDLAVDARVRMLDLEVTCPDGKPDPVFVLFAPGGAETPIAILLHSGAFDYVVDPQEDDVLAGEHYRARSRLDRTWSNDKVWETFGLATTEIDPPEENSGALPTALVNAGVTVVAPGNCWGDLWHGEAGVQEGEPDVDGFQRNGRAAAWETVELVLDGALLPVSWNGELYLAGLGEGGRGVTELLTHDGLPTIGGILVDSAPDDLSPYVDGAVAWADEVAGLERIFGKGLHDPVERARWTLSGAAAEDLLPERVAYLWSHLDPRVPAAAMEGFAAEASTHEANWVVDVDVARHVLTNGDTALAAQAADYLLTGKHP
jgi:hypothetical protein